VKPAGRLLEGATSGAAGYNGNHGQSPLDMGAIAYTFFPRTPRGPFWATPFSVCRRERKSVHGRTSQVR